MPKPTLYALLVPRPGSPEPFPSGFRYALYCVTDDGRLVYETIADVSKEYRSRYGAADRAVVHHVAARVYAAGCYVVGPVRYDDPTVVDFAVPWLVTRQLGASHD